MNRFDEVCDWIESVDGWETDCGQTLDILVRTPEETGMLVCIRCGRPIRSFYGTESEIGDK